MSDEIKIYDQGYNLISTGTIINNATLDAWETMDVSSGGSASNIEIGKGSMIVYGSGSATGITINEWGACTVSGGEVHNVIVNPGGTFSFLAGSATAVVENGGYVDFADHAGITILPNTISGIVFDGTYDTVTVHKNTIVSSITMMSGGLTIYSGGIANDVTMRGMGAMTVYNGGVVNNTNLYARMNIKEGCSVKNTVIGSYGSMHISSGGVANNTTVNSDGNMYISSGGVANNTTVNSAGYMYISSGGVASNTTVNNGGYMTVLDGGTAEQVVENGGFVYVVEGANVEFVSNTLTDITVSDRMSIHKNTIANNATINAWGYMRIYSGGVANNTTVNSCGSMFISSGGTATAIIENGGYVEVDDEANATFASNTVTGLLLNDSMTVHKNTIANSTTVASRGVMYISSGGVVSNTTFSGGDWWAGYGSMFISSGGVHKGCLQIESGSVVSAYEGSTIDFTIADRTAKTDYLINDLSLISGAPTYTITISAKKASGEYKLAQGAENFTGSITIGDGTVEYGTITVNGDVFKYNEVDYRLTQADGNLKLTIGNSDNTEPTADKYIFINSKYNEKTTGKKQNGITLTFGENAFASLEDAGDTSGKTVILLDSKNSGNYVDVGTIAGVVVVPVVKETDNSYSYKANSAPKGTLSITSDTGTTEFVRFATVNVDGAAVGNVVGGKESSSENTKTSVDKKGTVTDTEKTSFASNANGKFTAVEGSAATVKGYATVNLTSATVTELTGGNTKETFNSKLVDGETKDQKTISEVNDNVAAGSVTLKAEAKVDNIEQYKTVTLTDSVAGDITNFTSKDSKSDTFTFDEAKNTVARKVALTHTESTAGTFKATGSTVGDVTGFATVNLKNVTSAGDFRRVDADGDVYSTVKESLNIKTDKKGVVTGSYTRTETFTRAGKFTATGSTVGDIQNFSTVTLDGSKAEDISNFVEAKIVTTGTAIWDNAEAYGRPEDYAIDLQGWNMEEPIVTKSLNGSVTLKNGASASSITNFKSVTMTNSEVDGYITNVNKVTINKGDSTIGSYTGTDGNDTLSIAKGAVLTAGEIVLTDAKDTLALNGTLILSGSNFNVTKITGKGEIAAAATVWDDLDMDETVLNLGETSENFRGTAYEIADNSWQKAVKWDGKSEYNGWLGDWSGAKEGSDEVDFIKFKATADTTLQITGDVNWLLLDKKGNVIESKMITAAGDYIIQLENKKDKSTTYTINLA